MTVLASSLTSNERNISLLQHLHPLVTPQEPHDSVCRCALQSPHFAPTFLPSFLSKLLLTLYKTASKHLPLPSGMELPAGQIIEPESIVPSP
jgi:hypothetical protein